MPRPKGLAKTGGRLPGSLNKATIDKELHREKLRQLVIDALGPMTQAQIDHAQGVSYMVLRNPDGTFTRATDAKQIDAACAVGASAFRIFTQAPNPASYKDLMDRTLDKASEPAQTINLTGSINIVDILKQRHARRAQSR